MEVLHRFISGSTAINSRAAATTFIPPPPPASESNGSRRRRDPFCVRYYVHPTGESVIIIISSRAHRPAIIFPDPIYIYIIHRQVLRTTHLKRGRRDRDIVYRNFLPFTSNFQYPSFPSMFLTRTLQIQLAVGCASVERVFRPTVYT